MYLTLNDYIFMYQFLKIFLPSASCTVLFSDFNPPCSELGIFAKGSKFSFSRHVFGFDLLFLNEQDQTLDFFWRSSIFSFSKIVRVVDELVKFDPTNRRRALDFRFRYSTGF